MKKRSTLLFIMLATAVFLTGCEEGKTLQQTETEQKKVAVETGADESDCSDAAFQRESLQLPFQGGTYQVDAWQLFENPAEAGISVDQLSGYGIMLSETGKDFRFMLVKMSRISTADYEGNVADEAYVNLFFPVMADSLDAAYLPEGESDVVKRICMDHGYEPVYLDIGKSGESDYFKISIPPEEEYITYSLGFLLSEEEYLAGKNGELYLWYSMDEAQSTADLQLLFLSPTLLQEE